MNSKVSAPADRLQQVAGRTWRPGIFLWLQLGLHGVALMLWAMGYWPGALALVLVSHLAMMASGLWPRSTWMGQTWVRLPDAARCRHEVAITIDDGPDPEVTPLVLDILARYEVQASFFCIGTRAAQYPQLCRAMVAAGHRVENHGQNHPTLLSMRGLRGWRREVAEGQQTLHGITGQRPQFYRAVAGLRNVFLDPVLCQLGLQLASWTRRGFDTREADPQRVLARLTRGLGPGDVLLLHDGHAARMADGTPVIVSVLPRLIEALRERGLKPVTLVHACKTD